MTGRPAALSAFALASTASVADSAIPPIRAEIRRAEGRFASVAAVMRPIVPPGEGGRHPGSAHGPGTRAARFDFPSAFPVHFTVGGTHPCLPCPRPGGEREETP